MRNKINLILVMFCFLLLAKSLMAAEIVACNTTSDTNCFHSVSSSQDSIYICSPADNLLNVNAPNQAAAKTINVGTFARIKAQNNAIRVSNVDSKVLIDNYSDSVFEIPVAFEISNSNPEGPVPYAVFVPANALASGVRPCYQNRGFQKPNNLFFLSFVAHPENQVAGFLVQRTNLDTDGDGIPDTVDQCPEVSDLTNQCLPESGAQPPSGGAPVVPIDSDGDGIPDAGDLCPQDATNKCPAAAAAVPPTPVGTGGGSGGCNLSSVGVVSFGNLAVLLALWLVPFGMRFKRKE